MSKTKSGKFLKNASGEADKLKERILLNQYKMVTKKKMKVDPITKKVLPYSTDQKVDPIKHVVENQVTNLSVAAEYIHQVVEEEQSKLINTGSLDSVDIGEVEIEGIFKKIQTFHWYLKQHEVETVDMLFEIKSNVFGNQFRYREGVSLTDITIKYIEYIEKVVTTANSNFQVNKIVLECIPVYNLNGGNQPAYTTEVNFVEKENVAYVNDPFFYNFLKIAVVNKVLNDKNIELKENGAQIILDDNTEMLTNEVKVQMLQYVKLVELAIHECYLSKIRLTTPNFNVSQSCINLFNVDAPLCFGTLLKNAENVKESLKLLESKYSNGMMVITPIFMCFGPIMSVGFVPSIESSVNVSRTYYQRPAISGCFSVGGKIMRKTELISNIPVFQLSGDFEIEFKYDQKSKSYVVTPEKIEYLEQESYFLTEQNLYLHACKLETISHAFKTLSIPSYESQMTTTNQTVVGRFISRAKFGTNITPSDISLHITGPFRINGEVMTEVSILLTSMCEKWNGYMPSYKTVTAKTIFNNQEVLVVPNHTNTTLLSEEFYLSPSKLTYIIDNHDIIQDTDQIQFLSIGKVITTSSFNLTIQAYQNQGYSFSHINSFVKENWFFLDGFILLCTGVYEQFYTAAEIISATVSFGKNFEISLSADREVVMLKSNKKNTQKFVWKMDECTIHESHLQVGCFWCHNVFKSIRELRCDDYQQGLYEFINTRKSMFIPDAFGILPKQEKCDHCQEVFRMRSLAQLCHNSIKDKKNAQTKHKEPTQTKQKSNVEPVSNLSLIGKTKNDAKKYDDESNQSCFELFENLFPTNRTYKQVLIDGKREIKPDGDWNELIDNELTQKKQEKVDDITQNATSDDESNQTITQVVAEKEQEIKESTEVTLINNDLSGTSVLNILEEIIFKVTTIPPTEKSDTLDGNEKDEKYINIDDQKQVDLNELQPVKLKIGEILQINLNEDIARNLKTVLTKIENRPEFMSDNLKDYQTKTDRKDVLNLHQHLETWALIPNYEVLKTSWINLTTYYILTVINNTLLNQIPIKEII